MTAQSVLSAAIAGQGRVRVSPLLGYAFLLLVGVLTCAGIWLLMRTASGWDAGDDDGGDDGWQGGGGGGDTPPDPRPDGEPDWWPEFERAFAAHVNSRLTRSDSPA